MPNWRKLLIESGPIALTALGALIDALRGRNRPRFEYRVLIQAPREIVWRICTGNHIKLHGPPAIELLAEPLPGGDGLWLTRVAINGRPPMQIVTRLIEQDEVKGISVRRTVPHALSVPPEGGHDIVSGVTVETTPYGTVLTVFGEVTVHSFRDRIVYATGFSRLGNWMKQQCELEAGAHSRPTALPPRTAANGFPAGEPPAMSISNRAMGLSIAVAIGLLGGAAGSAMLPTAFEREFDLDLSHYQLAASLAQRDPKLRKLLLRRTEAAYNKGGWPAAQAALDTALATEVMVYADDEHVLAMARHTLRVLGKLESAPSDCKAYMLTGARAGDFPQARQVLDDDIPIKYAAIQNGFDRKSQGVTWRPLPDDAIADDARSLYLQPVALSEAELRALDEGIDGDATQYCSGSIKRLVNLLSQPPPNAARIERQLIYFSGRDDWLEVRETLCRRHDGRPGGLVCPQAVPVHAQR